MGGTRGTPIAIEDHAIIGDLNTVALVALDGTIDFFCFPRFDSPSVFASLLDPARGGHFSIKPLLNGATHKQLYLPDSNILLTRFLSADGVVEISDFMPVEEVGISHNLVRRVKCVRGETEIRMVCAPRFNYARSSHKVERIGTDGNTILFTSEGEDRTALRLTSSHPLQIENGDAVATFRLKPDESVSFVLEDAPTRVPPGFAAAGAVCAAGFAASVGFAASAGLAGAAAAVVGFASAAAGAAGLAASAGFDSAGLVSAGLDGAGAAGAHA
jgi:GH15 family glucan-1,4-alpha-glucosidase